MMYFLKWQLYYSSFIFLKSWIEFLKFGINLFSIPILLRTFFWPWHRYVSSYPQGIDPAAAIKTLFGNIMSRVIGMILRTFFILFGLIFEMLIVVVGLALFLVWVFLPFIALYLFYLGLSFLAS